MLPYRDHLISFTVGGFRDIRISLTDLRCWIRLSFRKNHVRFYSGYVLRSDTNTQADGPNRYVWPTSDQQFIVRPRQEKPHRLVCGDDLRDLLEVTHRPFQFYQPFNIGVSDKIISSSLIHDPSPL